MVRPVAHLQGTNLWVGSLKWWQGSLSTQRRTSCSAILSQMDHIGFEPRSSEWETSLTAQENPQVDYFKFQELALKFQNVTLHEGSS